MDAPNKTDLRTMRLRQWNAKRDVKMTTPTKSPITDKPLRVPGQSLEEEQRKLYEDKLETPLLLASCFLMFAGMEWLRYYVGFPPRPILFTSVALLLIAFFVWRLLRLLPQYRALRQGVEGERAVGQFLERLREKGYHVFHDLIGSGFNVDHVLIGPAGIFTVETKTRSKPLRGEPLIKFDGNQLTIMGREPDRNPIVQARAQAAWLKSLLVESTGRPLNVFPVVVYPGWFIEQSAGSLRSIWVLEPKALPKFLENEPNRLTPEDVRLASYHLSRFIRANERDRSAR
ncbi:nuclease-related domain-containing protein [Thioalkalivibrio thiocyanodenitrificans]|uniref:nuclease-related domain-containing protein n=1 Tax=Thioalkalivibrio thiocyanodenitrificans TaxID=243063 RepID=UPI0003681717|nr:nuclease-related domain-containing protein [Thioalkalivibrio thiocyanodenitrificans]